MSIDAEIVQRVVSEVGKMPTQEVLNDLKLLDPKNVSEKLGIGKSTVYTLANNGELPSVKVGGRLRFRPRALLAYVMLKEVSCRPETAAA